MGIVVQRGSGGDVGISNPGGVIYITGSEFVDGSKRIIVKPDHVREDEVAHVEKRTGGVWNPTTVLIAGETLLLGHNVAISAIGQSIKIESVTGAERKFLTLDVPFTDAGTGIPRATLTSALIPRIVLQPDFSVDTLAEVHPREITVTLDDGFVSRQYIQIGAVAPTADIRLTMTDGHVPGGTLIYDHAYPASDFPANTEASIPIVGGFGFFKGQEALITVSSSNAFSMLGTASGEPWFAADVQNHAPEDILTVPAGFDRLLTANDGNAVSDLAGNLVLREAA